MFNQLRFSSNFSRSLYNLYFKILSVSHRMYVTSHLGLSSRFAYEILQVQSSQIPPVTSIFKFHGGHVVGQDGHKKCTACLNELEQF